MPSKYLSNTRFRRNRRSFGLLGTLAALGAAGCLNRPVGEALPETYNSFVTKLRLTKVEKIDVLMMVDNSASMADKQKVMAAAVPQLLRRLTSPDCVSSTDANAAPIQMDNPSDPCEPGYEREFSPVKDIHIGVISSSLGDFGGDSCTPKSTPDIGLEDQGWLLGRLERTQDSLGSPFLNWSPSDAQNFSDRIDEKEQEFRDFVTAAGERGCGFEMSLESWYRFLIDPEPPKGYKVGEYGTERDGVDEELLDQRRDFLRPDSLLAIVMLTDENDCSIRDDGSGHLMMTQQNKDGTTFRFPRASSACKTDPNDRCCYSCGYQKYRDPACPEDPICNDNQPNLEDNVNLRCFDQKRRYGQDFLFPTERYVNALNLKTICPYQNYGTLDCNCTAEKKRGLTECNPGPEFANPIFDPTYSNSKPGLLTRTTSDMVFLAGIVGVPWQDIAQPEDPDHPELRYKLSSEIDWDLILPQEDGTPALDPLMHEQKEPRSGTHPITGEPIGLPTKETQRELNQINWHEWRTVSELQYACVFDIGQQLSETPEPARDCATICPKDDESCKVEHDSCPCDEKDWTGAHGKSPLCQDKNGRYGTIQHAAKAYPGIRQLQVLKGHNATEENNSIVASICPKELDWEQRRSRGYGYNPAVQALVDRLKTKLSATCLPRPLAPEDGKLPCAVIEAIPPSYSEWAECTKKGRLIVGDSLREAVRANLKADGLCDVAGTPGCSEFSFCQLRELTNDDSGEPLKRCQTQVGFENSSSVPGYCYVDPENGFGEKSIVDACPVNRKRMLRIVGDGDLKRAPAPGSWTFIACTGAANREIPNVTMTATEASEDSDAKAGE